MVKKRARKALILGLDAVTPVLMRQLITEGAMPNLNGLLRRGAFAEALAPVPGLTQPNWVSIATGAWPSTHGVTCHTVHYDGEPLDQVHNAYTSDMCHAEFLWNAAERAGKRSILMKYLNSWPPTIKQGIQVAGHGNPEGDAGPIICNAGYFTTELGEGSHIELVPGQGWEGLPPDMQDSREAVLAFRPKHGSVEKLHLLLGRRDGVATAVTIARTRHYGQRLAEIGVGKWSDWITLNVEGWQETDEASVRLKLQGLSPDGLALRLTHSGVHPNRGFAFPASVSQELLKAAGPFCDGFAGRGADPMTRQEVISCQAQWITKATKHLMARYPWDLYFLQWWWTDSTGHSFLNLVDPALPTYEERTGEEYWGYFKEEFAMCDRMLGELFACADEDTVVLVIADHGMVNGRTVFINNALRKAGLLSTKTDAGGAPVVDWSKTKAFALRSIYIHVNLKGRDPQGIVEPGEEYDKVRDQVIDALYDIREPGSNRRAVALAQKSEQAGMLGVHGGAVGDIVYLMAEGFGTLFPFSEDQVYGHHYKGYGSFGDWRLMEDVIFSEGFWSLHGSQVPGQAFGLSQEKAIFILAGPGVKKGYTIKSPVWIIDAAPTIAHLLGLPRPAQADGKVIHEALE